MDNPLMNAAKGSIPEDVTKKYEFTGETKIYDGCTLRRIRRLSDGRVGGWIELEENLSHEGGCFVYDEAMVFEKAKVYDNAQVYDHAQIRNAAQIYGDANVTDYALIFGNTQVFGNAKVCDHAVIEDDAQVFGTAKVCEHIQVSGQTKLYMHSIYDNDIWIYDSKDIKIYDYVFLKDLFGKE